jgi:cytochrome b561
MIELNWTQHFMVGLLVWAVIIWRCFVLAKRADKSGVVRKTAMHGAARFIERLIK